MNLKMVPRSVWDGGTLDKVPAWGRAVGVLALGAAIAVLLVPLFGVIVITIPVAMVGIIHYLWIGNWG